MSTHSLSTLTVSELSTLLRRKQLTAEDLVRSSLAEIERHQPTTNAFVAVDADRALEQAKLADQAVAHGLSLGPLHGIPVAIKDNYLTADLPTTASSRVLKDRPLGGEATSVARLREAGAIIIGKTNMHEWAYGATNEVSAFGPTRNPWNTDHITGGSSGGSGAAVAAGMVPVALGSDTGGSIRIPSAACGITGIKPTLGVVSRHGVLPLSWSFDCAGPMGRSAEDLALILKIMSGPDVNVPASARVRLTEELLPRRSLKGVRLGVLQGPGFERADDVDHTIQNALSVLREDGAELVEINLPGMSVGFGAWKVIMHAEASAYHRPFLDERAGDYADSVRIQLEAGRCLSATDYLAAQQYRAVFNREVYDLLSSVSALVTPTLPVTAPRLGQSRVTYGGREITSQDAMTCITWLANFTGLPAVTVPCGVGSNGLPVGLALHGRVGADYWLLDIAARFQMLTDWHRSRPTLNNGVSDRGSP